MGLNEKMTALADEIRELSGTTTSKSIDAMTSDIDAANAEISEQMGLIAQITAALEGKAGGTASEDLNAELTEYASLNTEFEEVINSLPNAGGGSGGNIETCTVTFDIAEDCTYTFFCLVPVLEDSQLNIIYVDSSTTLSNVVKGSDIWLFGEEGALMSCFPNGGNTEKIFGTYISSGNQMALMIRGCKIISDCTITAAG